MKICSHCKQNKDEIEFNRNRSKCDGLSTECKVCVSEQYKKNYYKSRAKRLEYQAMYRKNNPEKKRIWNRNWVSRNREKDTELKKKSRSKHRDSYNEYHRVYIRRPEVRRKHLVYNMNRIKRYRAVSDRTVTPTSIRSIFIKQKGKCALSGVSIESKYHIDHIVPVSKGGKHTIGNIQLLSPRVNLIKSNKLNYIYVG